MRHALTAAVALVASLGPSVSALAAAVNELAKARAEYARSQYQRTVDLLVPVLADPRQIADLTDEDAIEAHKLLGLSYFFLSQIARTDDRPKLLENAGIQFASLLFIDPDYVLDAAVEGPEAVQYFDAIKRDQVEQLEKIREQKRFDAERRTRPQRERLVLTVVHDPASWQNFMPFGYPQFKNGQTTKGGILLGVEGITFGTSVFLYLQHATRYGWPVGRLPTDPDEVDAIRTEQYVQIAAGALFLAVYAYGVYDGFKNQRPAATTTEEVRPIKYEDDKKSSLRLSPLVTGDAFGFGVTWEM